MAEKQEQPASNASPTPQGHPRRIQNFLVVWLDASIDEVENEYCRNTIAKLNEIVKDVNTFTDVNACVDFLSSIKEDIVFLISSGTFGLRIVSTVSEMSQVRGIYIFCNNQARHEQWAKDWPKVRGVFTEIKPICEALQKATLAYDQNSVGISLVAPTAGTDVQRLDELDQSFMYTQILKEILLTIDFDQSHIDAFIKSSRIDQAKNSDELRNVDKLERDYKGKSPIWWYSLPSFLYRTLNRALRLMEVDLIVSMGFFLRDLHEDIIKRHTEQFGTHTSSDKFTVFRGQGLSQTAFDQLLKTEGGLLSFNNFLSTSTNRQVSLKFAHETMQTTELVGVLFVLNIDPTIPSTPFAHIRDFSAIPGEDEILFSMHSIFRIGQIKQVDGNTRLWEVDLASTSDDDQQLRLLTDKIRAETEKQTGWDRLGYLMYKLGQFDQAESLYRILVVRAATEREKAYFYNQLGLVTEGQGKYAKAITLYEKSIKIDEAILSPMDPELASSYSNIGFVYKNMGEYSKALMYYEKDQAICQKTLPPNHPDLATSYNNIGVVYDSMGEYSKALEYYEKALAIRQIIFSPNDPDLAISYSNIGVVYKNMGDYCKALEYYEKDQAIGQKSLPPNHPDFVPSYNNIGEVYKNMGDCSKALMYHEKALEICQKFLSPDHPDLASSYNHIGEVYEKTGEYSKALEYHEKALAIRRTIFSPNHPDLATSYNNIGEVYANMNDYSKALEYYEKALAIRKKSLRPNHPSFTISYNNLGVLYHNMHDFSKALSFLECALDIGQCVLPANHPNIQVSKQWIETVNGNCAWF